MLGLSQLDKQLLNNFQKEFPVTSAPFAEIAARLGTDETTVLHRLEILRKKGYISRIGPVFKANGIGISLLAALAVPADRLSAVADLISSYEEVNHNYEREHHFNLWFVLTAQNIDRLDRVISEIEQRTGLPVLQLPLLEDYHIDLGFELQWQS
ncbi:MAG: heme d1 biosynthesis transcriptional regulator [Gammaproteobacteria bacterium]|nr:heme d1 biosynthesis transcriptional regulator [Gammaproteobacteria bacterium]